MVTHNNRVRNLAKFGGTARLNLLVQRAKVSESPVYMRISADQCVKLNLIQRTSDKSGCEFSV